MSVISACNTPDDSGLPLDCPGERTMDKTTECGGFRQACREMLQALDNMLDDKNITRPLYLVAHGFITGQYAVTWALAHPEAVEKLVIMDVPLSSEVCASSLATTSAHQRH